MEIKIHINPDDLGIYKDYDFESLRDVIYNRVVLELTDKIVNNRRQAVENSITNEMIITATLEQIAKKVGV